NSSLEFTSSQADGAKNKLAEQYVAIEIGGNRQSIRYPFSVSAKESLVQLVLQLTTRTDQWITFIEGHGEASPFTKTNRDISQFYQSIKSLGWPVAVQNLVKRPRIASNTKILVIAASQKQWLPAEINSIMRYLHEGGNLLLLREQKDQLPNELLSYLGISTELGVLIDWQGYQSGTPHPAILIVNQFTDHPVNTGIDSLLAFPWSYALLLDEKAKQAHRDYQTILATHSGVWTEHNSEQAELAFNEQNGELQQSFSIGYSLEDNQLKQRVIVMGDSSFLSDSAINNYANRQFSLNLISWLASQSNEVINQPYRDSYIKATPLLHFILTWLFSLILPLLFIIFLLAKKVDFGNDI
ncbi:MAG: GldG family protein, partial [Kangiellaceae bacterium]|nr:GldG family protein [Kangiellaceae bacterium]